MRVNERFKKFQKHDWVLLCKPFSCLEYPHTLEHKKLLRLILITSYAAYQSVFALLTSSSSRLLLAKLSIICITWLILFVWLTRNFYFGLKNSHGQRKSLIPKEKSQTERKVLPWKKKSHGERKRLALKEKNFQGKKKSRAVKRNSQGKESFSQ